MTIMKNLSRRVIAGGALQDYLTDDAGELWSGLVVDRHCCASASRGPLRGSCADRVIGDGLLVGRVAGQVGCDVAGRVRAA